LQDDNTSRILLAQSGKYLKGMRKIPDAGLVRAIFSLLTAAPVARFGE
jgi:hypothetical protein